MKKGELKLPFRFCYPWDIFVRLLEKEIKEQEGILELGEAIFYFKELRN